MFFSALFVVFTGWIGLGAVFNKPYRYKYPTSVEGCPLDNSSLAYNSSYLYMTNISSTTTETFTSTTTQSVDELFAER